MRIDHVALWTGDLERMRSFYVERLGGTPGTVYENPRTGFRSCFVSFEGGARVELMSRADRRGASAPGVGYAHLAFTVGPRAVVDAAVARLEAAGVRVAGRPRLTGDGYYEAVVEDPEGNLVELVAEPSLTPAP